MARSSQMTRFRDPEKPKKASRPPVKDEELADAVEEDEASAILLGGDYFLFKEVDAFVIFSIQFN